MLKAVLGLSGGMDSATLLAYLMDNGYSEIHCCSFVYGSKHNAHEHLAYLKLIDFYRLRGVNIVTHTFDLSSVFSDFKSNLLKSGGEIPEGHYESENMKLTVVPGRNMIFASIMAGLAESVNAEVVALGVHSGDHAIYPDCRLDFISDLSKAVLRSSDGAVRVIAPFIMMNKTAILHMGYAYDPPVPYHLTRTCYKDQQVSCGKCGSCQERLEAFDRIGRADPIEYENNN